MTFEKQLITLLLDGVYSVAWIDKGNSWVYNEDIFLSHVYYSAKLIFSKCRAQDIVARTKADFYCLIYFNLSMTKVEIIKVRDQLIVEEELHSHWLSLLQLSVMQLHEVASS